MKMAVHKKLRARQAGGQVKFMPQLLRCACKDGLRMRAIAAQLSRQTLDVIDICPGVFLPAFLLQAPQRLAGQIFNQNRVFLVRLVAGRGRLVIKAHGARLCILKFSQLSDLFASNTHEFPQNLTFPVKRRRSERGGPGTPWPGPALCAGDRALPK